MTRLRIIGSIIAVFGVLATFAWFDIPSTEHADAAGRRIGLLDYLVHTVATDNFGNTGGAIF